MADNATEDCPEGSQFTTEQKTLILYVYGGDGILSTIVCLSALLIMIRYKFYKDTIQRLLLWQLIAGLGLSLYNVLNMSFINYHQETSSELYSKLCSVVGYIGTVTLLMKMAFTFWLTLFLFRCLVCLRDPKDLSNMEIIYVGTSLGVPFLVSWVPFVHNLYGIAGAWCWISDWRDECANNKVILGVIEQYALIYASGTVLASVNAVLLTITFIAIICRMKFCVKSSLERESLLETMQLKHKTLLKKLLPLVAYPLMFILLFIVPLVNRIYGTVGERISFPLFMVHATVEPFWGLFVGATIIVHIFIIKCKKKRSREYRMQSEFARQCINNAENAFTVDTVASTNAKTYFEASSDSIEASETNASIVSTTIYKD